MFALAAVAAAALAATEPSESSLPQQWDRGQLELRLHLLDERMPSMGGFWGFLSAGLTTTAIATGSFLFVGQLNSGNRNPGLGGIGALAGTIFFAGVGAIHAAIAMLFFGFSAAHGIDNITRRRELAEERERIERALAEMAMQAALPATN